MSTPTAPAETIVGSAPGPVLPAAPAVPVEPPKTIASEYEIGDTSLAGSLVTSPAPKPVTPTPAPTPAAAPASKHSKRMLTMAADLGIDPADAEKMEKTALGEEIYVRTRELAAERKAQTRADLLTRNVQQPATLPAAVTPAPVVPATGAAVVPVAGEYDVDFDPLEWDDKFVQVGKYLKQLGGELKDVKAKLGSYEQAETRRQVESTTQTIDRKFAEAKAKHGAIFGDGPVDKLRHGGDEHLKRLAVVRLMDTMPGKTLEDKFDAAVSAIFGQGQQQTPAAVATPAAPVVTPEQWAAAGLAHPTDRNGSPEPKGEAKAIKSVQTFLKEHDMIAPEDALELEGFLG